jgi:AraC-like DNA-binding protein
MKVVSRSLLVFHPDARLRARVQQAAGRAFEVQVVSSWEALSEDLREASPAAFVIVDPYAGSGREARLAPELRDLLRNFPTVAVLAALEVRPERSADLRTLGAWGVMELLIAGSDDVLTITRVLCDLRGRPLQSLLERSLPEQIPARARPILDAAAEIASGGGKAEDLARRLHVSLRTLLRQCESVGLPPPRQVLAWMRILLAAELLDNMDRSMESIASACGYASDSGLRRAFYDFLGMSPNALRRAGAFTTASRAFQQALAEAGAKPAPAAVCAGK